MCADFRSLPAQLTALGRAGIRTAHLDFGDGRFVPNLPLGLEVFAQLPPRTAWIRECHLMIAEPLRLVALFAPHADLVTFHVEATGDPRECATAIRQHGASVGLGMNPTTPAERVAPWLAEVDRLLVMAVEPGFAGAPFVPEVVKKIRQLAALSDRLNPALSIEVDGAISMSTIPALVHAGADRFVGGSSGLFTGGDLEDSARALRSCIEDAAREGAA
jgi:ribulose-phosphate 3-epimerase